MVAALFRWACLAALKRLMAAQRKTGPPALVALVGLAGLAGLVALKTGHRPPADQKTLGEALR